MDYRDFAARIKTKYPDYADMDDEDLARRMVAKFPDDYGDIDFTTKAPASPAPSFLNSPLTKAISQGAVAPFDAARAAIAFGMGQPQPGLAGPSNVLGPMAAAGRGIGDLGAKVGPRTETVARALTPQTEGQAAGALAGEVGAGYVMAKAAPYASKAKTALDPLAQRLTALAEKHGVPLTAADIAKTDLVVKIENALKNTPITGDLIAAYRKRQVAAIEEVARKIAERSGTPLGKEEVAALANEARETALRSVNSQRDQAYALYHEKLGELGAGKINADATRLVSDVDVFAGDVLSEEGKTALRRVGGLIDTGIDEASTGLRYREGPPQISIESIAEARKAIDDLVARNKIGQKFMMGKEERVFSRIGARLSALEDQAAKSAGSDAAAILSDARNLHAKGKKLTSFKASKKIAAAVVQDGETASKLFNQLVTPNNATQLRAVRKVVGDKGFENFGARFVQEVIESAGPNFERPEQIVKTLDRLRKPGDNTLSVLLPKETVKALDDLAFLINQTKLDTKGFQGSAGAQFMKTMMGAASAAATVGGAVGGIPGAVAGGAASVALPYGVGKLYLSAPARNFLVRGFSIPAGSPQAAAWATRMSAIAASKGLAPDARK